MTMFKYILKRLLLCVVVFFVIMTICFVLIKQLQPETPMVGAQAQTEMARREALGYDKPVLVQYGIYLKHIFTEWDWGTSWEIDYMEDVTSVIGDRLTPTILINLYSIFVAVPIGILLGIWAALKKNTFIDHFLSVIVMLFISVPSYVYAFLVQYYLGFKAGAFPVVLSSLYDAGGSWFSWKMLSSMVLPVMALSFGIIASMTRFTRAELSEALTSDYVLLARTKGMTRRQSITRHALKNSMVPILPSIISLFVSVIGGAMIIESIFAINGVGRLYLQSVTLLDYDVFMATSMFYAGIDLVAMILVDLSYGFLDPRIRMGEK